MTNPDAPTPQQVTRLLRALENTEQQLAESHRFNDRQREINRDLARQLVRARSEPAPPCPTCTMGLSDLRRRVQELEYELSQVHSRVEVVRWQYRGVNVYDSSNTHEVSEPHALAWPEEWEGDYRPERRALYAGPWQEVPREAPPEGAGAGGGVAGHSVLSEAEESLLAGHGQPAACCVCGRSPVVHYNYQNDPFCSPCSEGRPIQA